MKLPFTKPPESITSQAVTARVKQAKRKDQVHFGIYVEADKDGHVKPGALINVVVGEVVIPWTADEAQEVLVGLREAIKSSRKGR